MDDCQPAEFTDSDGRQWVLRLTWAAMRRSAAAGVDLSKVELYLADWFRGSHTLIDALYAVLKPQCEAEKPPMDQESFEERIAGPVVPRAAAALVQALENFFPPERAELLAEALEETRREFAGLREQLRRSSTERPATLE